MSFREIRPKSESRLPALGPLRASGNGAGWVMIVGAEDASMEIKIGFSKNPQSRLTEYQKYFPHGMRLLAMVRGDKTHEKTIHSYFRDECSPIRLQNGSQEFFHPSERLVNYIGWLRNQYFVAVDLADLARESCNQTIDSSVWLPGPGREETKRAENLDLFGGRWSILPQRLITGEDYYTPEEIIHRAHLTMGGIDLDPASHVHANQIVRARRFYSVIENGLIQPWAGRVWLNPPFSSYEEWSNKALEELSRGQITALLMLAGSRAITANYYKPILDRSQAQAVLNGRWKFWGIETENGSPAHGQIVTLVLGDIDLFAAAFGDIGTVFVGYQAYSMATRSGAERSGAVGEQAPGVPPPGVQGRGKVRGP